MRTFFEDNRAKLGRPERMRVAHVALLAPAADPAARAEAIRGRFRYGGAQAACGQGLYDDHDDVAFAVEYTPNAAYDAKLKAPACAGAGVHRIVLAVGAWARKSTHLTFPYAPWVTGVGWG
ncbi:hypothetical protein [Anaeromyxobacter sp. Fw109-5]|uniref:hypothetical protein n=1 Tax=Anaeromyxobacter sp. (strain Fw109-5) TaxID=404589 RepID=UPI000158A754|nr:hypothetical protein [Anaeromyxobacter sp. Fw109-5]ABS26061.1 hypothetical protein Anae109_1858 [Anaeromyxobacter sp. Fw109-5]